MLLMEPLRRRPRPKPAPAPLRPVGRLRKAQRELRSCIRAGKDLAREYLRVEAERNAALKIAQDWQTETGLQRQLYLDFMGRYDPLQEERDRLRLESEKLQADLDAARHERDEARAVARRLYALGRRPPFPPDYDQYPWLREED